MPQLSIETFVTQYLIIPRISLIIKSREITSWLSGTTLSLTEIKKAPEYKRVTYNRRENKTTWEV